MSMDFVVVPVSKGDDKKQQGRNYNSKQNLSTTTCWLQRWRKNWIRQKTELQINNIHARKQSLQRYCVVIMLMTIIFQTNKKTWANSTGYLKRLPSKTFIADHKKKLKKTLLKRKRSQRNHSYSLIRMKCFKDCYCLKYVNL